MQKPALFFLVTLFVLITSANHSFAQSNDYDSRITVDAVGQVQVPADLIQFRVNITQFKKDAKEAFDIHKQQENYLTNLLLEEGIADSNITANPISISYIKRYNNNSETGYETQQQVVLTLDDISQFEAMQIKLIENGFTNFSGSFTSTKFAEASDKALKNAVEEARRKAEILAEAAGKEITDVLTINYHSSRPYAARAESVQMAFDAGNASLLQFERTIPVTENVSVQFQIK